MAEDSGSLNVTVYIYLYIYILRILCVFFVTLIFFLNLW